MPRLHHVKRVLRLALWRSVAAFYLLSSITCLAQEVETLRQGVVRIDSYIKEAKRTGTGFIVKLEIDRVHILTATHVVQGADRIEVTFFARPEGPVPASVRTMEDDEAHGIAYIVASGRAPDGTRALEVAAQSLLKEGKDEALTIGFPQGAPAWSPKRLAFSQRDRRELLFDGKVNQGNSGGPLLKEGQVVALVQRERDGYVRATSSASILEFLEGSGVKLAEPRSPPGAQAPSRGAAADPAPVAETPNPGAATNAETAARLLEAAKRGDVEAMAAMVDLYLAGWGVEQNYAAAATWLRRAADAGDAKTLYMAGAIEYIKALGNADDDVVALRLLLNRASKNPMRNRMGATPTRADIKDWDALKRSEEYFRASEAQGNDDATEALKVFPALTGDR